MSQNTEKTFSDRPPARGPGHDPFGCLSAPAEKAMNFGPSAKRLLGKLRPERLRLGLVRVLAVASVTFSVLGPRLLGEGTNLIFSGIISRDLPVSLSQEQVIDPLRASGDVRKADLLSGMTLTLRQGIGFAMLSTGCSRRWRSTCCPRCSPTCRPICSTASCSAPCSASAA